MGKTQVHGSFIANNGDQPWGFGIPNSKTVLLVRIDWIDSTDSLVRSNPWVHWTRMFCATDQATVHLTGYFEADDDDLKARLVDQGGPCQDWLANLGPLKTPVLNRKMAKQFRLLCRGCVGSFSEHLRIEFCLEEDDAPPPRARAPMGLSAGTVAQAT